MNKLATMFGLFAFIIFLSTGCRPDDDIGGGPVIEGAVPVAATLTINMNTETYTNQGFNGEGCPCSVGTDADVPDIGGTCDPNSIFSIVEPLSKMAFQNFPFGWGLGGLFSGSTHYVQISVISLDPNVQFEWVTEVMQGDVGFPNSEVEVMLPDGIFYELTVEWQEPCCTANNNRTPKWGQMPQDVVSGFGAENDFLVTELTYMRTAVVPDVAGCI